MSVIVIDGLRISFETHGSGPALLMAAGGGFNSIAKNWSTQGIWKEVQPLDVLSKRFTCIAYDRREAGESGGHIERLSWDAYVREGRALLDHLGIRQAFVMGGCMGVSFAVAFAVAYPESTLGMILAQPAGGPRWRMNAQRMFSQHAAFAEERGLKAVVQLARERRTTFQAEPLVGPWGWTIARDDEFADRFLERDPSAYVALVRAIGPAMFDRDTVPGADAEELMALHVPALIIPDDTTHHAPSGAHYLRECLPAAVYHNVHPTEQTPEMVRDWLLKFLDSTVEAAAKDESARPG